MYIHIFEYLSCGMVRAVTGASMGGGACIFTYFNISLVVWSGP